MAFKVLAVVALLGTLPLLGGFGGDQIEIRIHHSRFSLSELEVDRGKNVTFIVNNDDPIDHEFIVGDEAVHARHARGTEEAHGEVPGEVSVPAKTTRATTFTFTEPGTYRFVCHLPGHERYGMVGVVTVTG